MGDGIALEFIMKVIFKLTFLVRDWQLPPPSPPREKKEAECMINGSPKLGAFMQ